MGKIKKDFFNTKKRQKLIRQPDTLHHTIAMFSEYGIRTKPRCKSPL